MSSGFLNTFGAVYVGNSIRFRLVSLSVMDYKYNLRDLEYNTPEYFSRRSVIHGRVAERILSLSLSNRGVYLKAG